MRGRKVPFAELPAINDVTIQYKYLRTDAAEVVDQFPGMATICAQVNIGDNNNAKVSFFQVYRGLAKNTTVCYLNETVSLNYHDFAIM